MGGGQELRGAEMRRRKRGRTLGDTTISQLPNPAGGVRIQTFVPWTLVKRRNSKQIITPLGSPQEFQSEAVQESANSAGSKNSALIRALAQAHHWQRLLDEQRVGSLVEIAEAEQMDVTQIRRVIRLTLLAPDIIEKLVDSTDVVLDEVMRRPWPSCWKDQLKMKITSA